MNGDEWSGYDELEALVAEHRAAKTPRPKALPPLPKINGAKLLDMSEAEREQAAAQQARQWQAETLAMYRNRGWLDEATEAKIAVRANIHYRSIVGRDMPTEPQGESQSAGNDPAVADTATAAPVTVAPSERLAEHPKRPTHYNRRTKQWERGHSGRVPFGAYGPETLRKRSDT